MPVSFRTWILDAAPETTEAATSLYVSTFNLVLALGALFGDSAVDGIGTTSVLWTGASLAVLTLLVVGGSHHAAAPSAGWGEGSVRPAPTNGSSSANEFPGDGLPCPHPLPSRP
ncbi:hypothetical protein WJ438_10015 [Streptomyces sp. GD-15H]|uniref:hypothetical protein n=1 Tax=Streptomyces sp. GD-15H TaxID=3129112 RepID=UPI00324A96EB